MRNRYAAKVLLLPFARGRAKARADRVRDAFAPLAVLTIRPAVSRNALIARAGPASYSPFVKRL